MRRPARQEAHPLRCNACAGPIAACLCAALLLAAPQAAAGVPARPVPAAPGAPTAPPLQPHPRSVVRGFEPPAGPFSPGHRGVDIALEPGTPVAALLDGTVAFAGPVAGGLFVTVAHPGHPPQATTWSFLSRVDVEAGRVVRAGDILGASGPGHPGQGRPGVHLALRRGGRYIDPSGLLGLPPADISGLVSLGPLPGGPAGTPLPQGPAPRAPRRGPIGPYAVRDVPPEAPGEPGPSPRVRAAQSLLGGVARAFARQAACNRAARAAGPSADRFRPGSPPPPAPNDNAVIAVAGLGSSTARGPGGRIEGHAAMYRFDLRRLGYPPGRIFHFSYAGSDEQAGEAGGPYRFHVPYGREATHGPLTEAAARLARLVEQVHAAEGREVDIVAHSQGGVVAHYYLTHLRRAGGPVVEHLVTIASPHLGADLAGLSARLGRGPAGRNALLRLDAVAAAAGSPPPGSPAARDLAAGSALMRSLAGGPPPGVATTTIAAAFDVVVPPQRTRLPGAAHYTVDLPWAALWAHSAVVAARQTKAVVHGALAGRPAPCTALRDALADHLPGRLLAMVEDRVLDAVAGAARGG